MGKILRNPKPSEIEAASKAGRPMVRLADEGEVVTMDRVLMLPGGARKKVHAGAWKVLRYGTSRDTGRPVATLEAVGRDLLTREGKSRRWWSEKLAVVITASLLTGAGLASAAWWVLG